MSRILYSNNCDWHKQIEDGLIGGGDLPFQQQSNKLMVWIIYPYSKNLILTM